MGICNPGASWNTWLKGAMKTLRFCAPPTHKRYFTLWCFMGCIISKEKKVRLCLLHPWSPYSRVGSMGMLRTLYCILGKMALSDFSFYLGRIIKRIFFFPKFCWRGDLHKFLYWALLSSFDWFWRPVSLKSALFITGHCFIVCMVRRSRSRDLSLFCCLLPYNSFRNQP